MICRQSTAETDHTKTSIFVVFVGPRDLSILTPAVISPDSLPAPVRVGSRAGRVVSRRGSVPPVSAELVLSITVKVSPPLVRIIATTSL